MTLKYAIKQNGRFFTLDGGWNSADIAHSSVWKFASEQEARDFARDRFNWRNFTEEEMTRKLADMEFIGQRVETLSEPKPELPTGIGTWLLDEVDALIATERRLEPDPSYDAERFDGEVSEEGFDLRKSPIACDVADAFREQCKFSDKNEYTLRGMYPKLAVQLDRLETVTRDSSHRKVK